MTKKLISLLAIAAAISTAGCARRNNTWYYVHTLGVFYIHQVFVQGSNVDDCANPPGNPTVEFTTGGGFYGEPSGEAGLGWLRRLRRA